MNKRDALRLKQGDRIVFGSSMWLRRCINTVEADVLFVTPRGGIKVRCDNGREKWVPYHHVVSAWKKRRMAT